MSNTRDEVGQPDGSVAFFPEPPRVQQWVDPASPDWCLAKHSERSLYLSAFEQVEIKSYPHVWFVGKPGVTKPVPRRAGTVPPENIRLANANRESNENSNDDEWDDPHDVVFVDHTRHYSGLALGDHLGFRFEICSTLGKGTFAKVVKCLDHKTGQSVAVKVTRNARRFKQQVRSEIKILNLLGRTPGHHNVVALTETFAFRGHQCLVFPEHGVSLAEWLRNENNDKNDAGEKQTLKLKQSSSRVVGASSGFTKRVGTQLVQALLFLENNAVIHCDLKLENILLRRANGNSSQIVLVDFGSAVFCDDPCTSNKTNNQYVQSRFYRAPEVLLGLPFTFGIDCWSLGCVLCELYTGRVAFCGTDTRDQIGKIIEVLGPVPVKVLRVLGDEKRDVVSSVMSKSTTHTRSVKHGILDGCCDADFVDFCEKLLSGWSSVDRNRLDVRGAAKHPWISDFGGGFAPDTKDTTTTSFSNTMKSFSYGQTVGRDPHNGGLPPFAHETGNNQVLGPHDEVSLFTPRLNKNVSDLTEIARRDDFFKSVLGVTKKQHTTDSILKIEKKLASKSPKRVDFAVRPARAVRNGYVGGGLIPPGEISVPTKNKNVSFTARRSGDDVRVTDDAYISRVTRGEIHDVQNEPRTTPAEMDPITALIKLHPGMTEDVARRVGDIKSLQAVYSVPTGPPRRAVGFAAQRYSGVNPPSGVAWDGVG